MLAGLSKSQVCSRACGPRLGTGSRLQSVSDNLEASTTLALPDSLIPIVLIVEVPRGAPIPCLPAPQDAPSNELVSLLVQDHQISQLSCFRPTSSYSLLRMIDNGNSQRKLITLLFFIPHHRERNQTVLPVDQGCFLHGLKFKP